MRYGATLSLLFAAASVAPAVLAMPFGAASSEGLEVRAFNDEVADLVARSGFDGATELLARAVAEVLDARTNDDAPGYKKDDPINGKKPKYTVKDPAPIQKYRQKDPHPAGGHPAQRPKPKPDPKHPRDLAEVDGLWARADLEEMWARELEAVMARTNDDAPGYKKDDPINGKKPKYTVKDPAPIQKYRQKDPHPAGGHPAQRPKSKPDPKHPRELADYWW
ncbi:hypothetical protein DAEQUDRAFT_741006 [Daedalea quercina L-15889]|uniref:Uncharacterized protein n=1 Tax=Daedalea quercina L-15889 TaxID=1314783 RepID=A0A165LV56_9APHY|nr:hypothetical protein DAEQUDRAFT_741006 [Daedalea quercina L-15889]